MHVVDTGQLPKLSIAAPGAKFCHTDAKKTSSPLKNRAASNLIRHPGGAALNDSMRGLSMPISA
jgi:hypothetical protein